MYLLDDAVEIDAEMQSSTVDDVEEVSQRIGYPHKIVGFHGRPQFAGFFLDEFASADSTGDGNGRPCAHGGTDVLVKLANQPDG
jgi:hypothetical protein